jgi:hypothetical protein
MDDILTAFGAEVGDLAGTVQKEFGLEAAAKAGGSKPKQANLVQTVANRREVLAT